MPDNIKEIFNTILDFCRENQQTVMIAGAGIVVLIILIAVIRSLTKKSGSAGDLDFDEDEFVRSLAYSKKQREEALAAEAAGLAREEERAAYAEAAALEKTAQSAAKAQMEKSASKTLLTDDLVGEIAGNMRSNLQEIDIKIQNAELKFRYAGSEARSVAEPEKKEAKTVIEPVRIVEIADSAAAYAAQDAPESTAASEVDANGEGAEPAADGQTEPATDGQTEPADAEAVMESAEPAADGQTEPATDGQTEPADAEAVMEPAEPAADSHAELGAELADEEAAVESADPEAESADPEAAAEIGEETEAEQDPEIETETEPETEAEPEIEAEPEPEPEPFDDGMAARRSEQKERHKVRELTQAESRPSFQEMLRFSAERRNRSGYDAEDAHAATQPRQRAYSRPQGSQPQGSRPQGSRPQDERLAEKAAESQAPAGGKFGPDNRNVSRSGRVYTEEELIKQIKD